MSEILIERAPLRFKPFFVKADEEGNQNGEIDSPEEAQFAYEIASPEEKEPMLEFFEKEKASLARFIRAEIEKDQTPKRQKIGYWRNYMRQMNKYPFKIEWGLFGVRTFGEKTRVRADNIPESLRQPVWGISPPSELSGEALNSGFNEFSSHWRIRFLQLLAIGFFYKYNDKKTEGPYIPHESVPIHGAPIINNVMLSPHTLAYAIQTLSGSDFASKHYGLSVDLSLPPILLGQDKRGNNYDLRFNVGTFLTIKNKNTVHYQFGEHSWESYNEIQDVRVADVEVDSNGRNIFVDFGLNFSPFELVEMSMLLRYQYDNPKIRIVPKHDEITLDFDQRAAHALWFGLNWGINLE